MFVVLSKLVWFWLAPSNLLLGLVAAGLAAATWGSRRTARAGRWLSGLSFALLLAGGLGPPADWLLAALESRFPPFADEGRPVAGIIVLGGGVRSLDSVVHRQLQVTELGDRVIAMADLARRHPTAQVVVSGGGGLWDEEPAESEVTRRFAPTLGLDPARILAETRSLTTAENAAETAKLIRPAPGELWLLVTSAWHMPRAIAAFRAVGLPVTAYPVDYLAPPRGRSFGLMPTVGFGLNRLDLAAKEWVGLLAYRLSGRSSELLPAPSPSGAIAIR